MVKKEYIISTLALLAIISLWFYGPIPQDPSYHNFSDQREIWGIPNFLNVITNLPFAAIGIMGLYITRNMEPKTVKVIGVVLFTGFLLLTAGSGYYHLKPNNTTLVYDRIPIVIIIMSFFSLIIENRMHPRTRYLPIILLNAIGVLSVIYWAWTENLGNGDLRWYAMAQFFPIVAIPIILWLYKSAFNYRKEMFFIYLSFALAKLAESYDFEIFRILGRTISGHSLKHLFMAAAGYGIILMFRRQRKTVQSVPTNLHL